MKLFSCLLVSLWKTGRLQYCWWQR